MHEISRYVHSPGEPIVKAIRNVFKYLKKTADYGLMYDTSNMRKVDIKLGGYADSSWAEDSVTRKSLGGYLVTMGNCVVAHRAKLSSVIALSSTEAEIYAAGMLARELIWMRQLLQEMGEEPGAAPMILKEDNQGCMAWASKDNLSRMTKHINVRWHHLRSSVKNGEIKMVYTKTEDQVADVLTKALSRTKFEKFRARMGVIPKETFYLGRDACMWTTEWVQ